MFKKDQNTIYIKKNEINRKFHFRIMKSHSEKLFI